MGTNYIAPIWRMPENTNKDKLSNYTIRWDNTNQGILTAPLEDFGIDNTFSFSLWAKPNSDVTLGSYAHLFSNAQLNSGGFGLYLAGDGNDSGTSGDLCFRFYVDNYNISGRFINSEPINTEQWYHIVVTYSDAVGANMYIDNASPITGISGRTAAAPNVSVGIGCAVSPVYGARYQAKSSISEVCLFDYIISADQVQYLYNLNNPMVIPGGEPVGYWRIGSNSNPLALAGYPNTSVGADSVFDFDGTDYIEGASTSFLNNATQMSLSVWFNLDAAVINKGIVDDQDKHLAIYTKTVSGSDYSFRINLNGSANRFQITGTPFTAGKWHNLIMTFNAGTLNFYIDGNSAAYSVYSGSIPSSLANNTGTLDIGRYSTLYWDGKISNVQVWNTNLTGAEVTTLYNNGQPLMTGTQPQATNLKVWYKLNQSSNWEADSAGNWQIPDATSAFPQSFKFIQANNDAIDTGSINLGTENSISFWFNFNDAGSTQTIIGSSGTQKYIIQFGGNYIGIRPDGGSDVFYSPYFTLIRPPYKTQGVWGHYLITRNGNTIRLFINGDEKAVSGTGTGMGSTIINRIGTSGGAVGGSYANGEISNVAFWNSDQSSEKDNIYNDGTPATSYTNTPQYWYKLDNTSVWNPAPANYWTFPNAGEQDNSGIFNFSN